MTTKRIPVEIPDFPRTVHIGVTNLCNHDCVFCPRTELPETRYQRMSMDLFTSITEQLSDRAEEVERIALTGWGEPSIDAKLLERLRLLKKKVPGIHVYMFTNGMGLESETAETILKEELLDRVNVSIDGGDRQSVATCVGHDCYDVKRQNVTRFVKKRDDLNADVSVEVNMVTTPYNLTTVSSFVDQWKETADYCYPKPMLNEGGNLFKLHKSDKPSNHDRHVPCSWLTEKLWIAEDGAVNLCVFDTFQEHDFGNVRERSIEEIWHSEAFEQVRKAFFGGEWGALPLCRDCCVASPTYSDEEYMSDFYEATRGIVVEGDCERFESLDRAAVARLIKRRNKLLEAENAKEAYDTCKIGATE